MKNKQSAKSVVRGIDKKYILGITSVATFLVAFYIFGGFAAIGSLLRLNEADAQGGLNPTPQAATCPASLTTAAPGGSTDISATNFGVNQTLNAGNYFSNNPLTISATLTINGQVNIYAPSITVAGSGSVVGIGTGRQGGAGVATGQATQNGTGPGAGHGGNPVNPDGAGGGGYGGDGGGGNNCVPGTCNGGGAGGAAYGLATDYTIDQGSGGGGGNCDTGTCNGGDSGAGLGLYAQNLTVAGNIRLNGTNGDSTQFAPLTDAAGGGSGGGILLSGWKVNVTGILRTTGGAGGDSTSTTPDPSNDDAGGGGGGGRIKIFAYNGTSSTISPSTVDVRGGAAGQQDASNTPGPGQPGTYATATCAAPALGITKTPDSNPVAPGQTYHYTVVVTNTTDGTLNNVVAVDDYDQSKITITNSTEFASNNGNVLTTAAFSLAPGASQTFHYTAQVKNPYITYTTDADKRIQNTVTVTSDNYPNQQATATVNVVLVQMAKSLDPNTIVSNATKSPGSSFPVYLAMQNDSLVDVSGISVVDDLSTAFSAGLITNVSAISNGGVFDSATKKITWSNLSIAQGGSSTQLQLSFTIQVPSVLPAASNTINNSFTLTQTQIGSRTSNTVTVTIPASPNIIAVKQATVNNQTSTGNAHPGDKVGFNIQFVNVGSLAATNFVVSDDFLNSLVTEIPTSGSATQRIAKTLLNVPTLVVGNGGSKQSSDAITWNIGTLNPVAGPCSVQPNNTISCTSGTPQNVGFSVNLASTMPESGTYTFTNVATYSSTQASGTTNQNQVQVPATPLISISKCIQPGCVLGNQVNPGDQFTYRLNVQNTGTAPATNVSVRDPFTGQNQSYLTYISSPTAPDSQNPLTWNFATLNPGETKTIDFVVKLADTFPSGQTQIQNTGQVVTDQTPFVPSNVVTTTTVAAPNISITKAVDKATANPGDTINYTLTVRNVGNATASSVVVDDPLTGNNRDYLTFVSANPAPTTTGSTAGTGSSSRISDLIWDLGSMAPGTTRTITIAAKIAATMPQGQTTIVDTAVVTSVTPNIPSNPVPTVVTATPQLTIVKSVDKSAAAPGDSIVYTLTYANAGNADAHSVTIADPFTGQNQKYLSFTSSSPTFTSASNYTLIVPTLAAHANGTLKITSKVLQTPCTPPSTTTNILNKGTISATGVNTIDSNQVTTAVAVACAKPATGTPSTKPVPKTGAGTTLTIVAAMAAGALITFLYVGKKQGWLKSNKNVRQA